MTGQCEKSTHGRPGINREIRYETTWDTTILAQEPVGAAVSELHGVVALEPIERACISVDADVVQRRRLAPHDRAPTEMGLDVGVLLPNILPIVTRRS